MHLIDNTCSLDAIRESVAFARWVLNPALFRSNSSAVLFGIQIGAFATSLRGRH